MSGIRHYLQFKDLSAQEYAYLFQRIAVIKHYFKTYEKYTPLTDRTLAMIFEKASTRTRLSFEAGMSQLGGHAIYFDFVTSQITRGETMADTARVMSR